MDRDAAAVHANGMSLGAMERSLMSEAAESE
jgi:hypothetical protein